MSTVRYTRERHAAHDPWTGRALWDLECWDVEQTFGAPRPSEVPVDADRAFYARAQQLNTEERLWCRALSKWDAAAEAYLHEGAP